MGSVAEFERQITLERQREGIVLAKEHGIYKGRNPLSQKVVNKLLNVLGWEFQLQNSPKISELLWLVAIAT